MAHPWPLAEVGGSLFQRKNLRWWGWSDLCAAKASSCLEAVEEEAVYLQKILIQKRKRKNTDGVPLAKEL